MVGGVEYLCAVAREDPKAFCALLGKLIRVKVADDEENPLVLHATIDRPSDETREPVACPEQRRRRHGRVVQKPTD